MTRTPASRARPRAAGGPPFAIDLHVHTKAYSPCSVIEPDDLPRAAKAAGLAAVVITEHLAVWTPRELARLRRLEPDLLILNGAELHVQEGDFVVIGVDSWDGLMDPMPGPDLLAKVRARGGFAIWAHPFRFGEPADRFAQYLRPDAVEVASSNMPPAVAARAAALAQALGVLAGTTSDAHAVAAVGRHPFHLPRPVADEADLVRCLREMASGPRRPRP